PGGPGPWLRFRTAPRASDLVPISFLFSADIGPNEKLHDIFPGLAVRSEGVYLHLGDWPYADKNPAARTVEEFRDKHRQVRSPRAIQEFMWRIPIAPIYDDHDITNGWTRSLLDRDPDLFAAGMQVWSEFFPLSSTVAYRDFRWGALAHFFVLDTRRYRDDPDLTAADSRQFLGGEQYDWLTAGLSGSDAVFKLIVTSVPFDFNGSVDDWGAYELEKSRLRAFLADSGTENVIFLTADRHWFAARHLSDGLREFQVGPLAAGLGMYPEAFPPEVVASALLRNYGAISIAPDLERGIATLRFTCVDEHHVPVYQEIIEAPLGS
ncbi:MAG TPA: alkaline phosphatase D family protein, partial [Kofleriaceae bacterium]|nr:alkaline phosphatase D family protein [Kofleriaceae bacterium]